MKFPIILAAAAAFVAPVSAQTNAELEAKIEALAAELERRERAKSAGEPVIGG